mmetsp:Transcript_41640/g.120227  ORF Transcript_41640/g.120227 Transcript_41640/m.120227 type:complete len:278 (+) Transcript_41640:393-1226(+)
MRGRGLRPGHMLGQEGCPHFEVPAERRLRDGYPHRIALWHVHLDGRPAHPDIRQPKWAHGRHHTARPRRVLACEVRVSPDPGPFRVHRAFSSGGICDWHLGGGPTDPEQGARRRLCRARQGSGWLQGILGRCGDPQHRLPCEVRVSRWCSQGNLERYEPAGLPRPGQAHNRGHRRQPPLVPLRACAKHPDLRADRGRLAQCGHHNAKARRRIGWILRQFQLRPRGRQLGAGDEARLCFADQGRQPLRHRTSGASVPDAEEREDHRPQRLQPGPVVEG